MENLVTSSGTEGCEGFWKSKYRGMHSRCARLEGYNAILMLALAGVIAYLLFMG